MEADYTQASRNRRASGFFNRSITQNTLFQTPFGRGAQSHVLHDCIIYHLWRDDAVLIGLLFKHLRVDSVGNLFHATTDIMEKIVDLSATPNRQRSDADVGID